MTRVSTIPGVGSELLQGAMEVGWDVVIGLEWGQHRGLRSEEVEDSEIQGGNGVQELELEVGIVWI